MKAFDAVYREVRHPLSLRTTCRETSYKFAAPIGGRKITNSQFFMTENLPCALWHKRCSLGQTVDASMNIQHEKLISPAAIVDIYTVKMKLIDIKKKTALLGGLGLIALAMVQGCSTMAGSLDGSDPTLYRSQSVGEIVPVAMKPSVETLPHGDTRARSLSKISSKVKVGEASWYGPGFRGKKTASGEIFDDEKLTAAHKTIPLGSKAKVTNLDNHKSVEVEINDRGPYVKGRIIDLSQAAARALDIVEQGTAEVRVEVLNHE